MTIHKIPEKKADTSEYYSACLEVAKLRMESYKAHIDAGFDHEGAMVFTQLDTHSVFAEDEWEEDEEQGEMEIIFIADFDGDEH